MPDEEDIFEQPQQVEPPDEEQQPQEAEPPDEERQQPQEVELIGETDVCEQPQHVESPDEGDAFEQPLWGEEKRASASSDDAEEEP